MKHGEPEARARLTEAWSIVLCVLSALCYLMKNRLREVSAALMLAGFGGLLLLAPPSGETAQRFYANWLIWLMFYLCLGLGALFWVALEHLVSAHWSVPFRRVPERLSFLLFLVLVLTAIACFGLHALYPWARPEAYSDPVIAKKALWLNIPAFSLRAVLCAALWAFFCAILSGASLRHDLGNRNSFYRRAKARSAAFMLFFGLSICVAAFDWLMSLEPKWYSTICGVYLFAECSLAALCATTLFSLYLKRCGRLCCIKPSHLYNLGALIFGFSAFWAYIAYSQFMLIWYGNLPEETGFYLLRLSGTWYWISLFLPLGHFLIPFLMLLSRPAKSNERILCCSSVLLLVSIWLSLYWFIFPVLGQGVLFGTAELCAALGFLGLGSLVLQRAFLLGPDMPETDPDFKAALEFSL